MVGAIQQASKRHFCERVTVSLSTPENVDGGASNSHFKVKKIFVGHNLYLISCRIPVLTCGAMVGPSGALQIGDGGADVVTR